MWAPESRALARTPAAHCTGRTAGQVVSPPLASTVSSEKSENSLCSQRAAGSMNVNEACGSVA